MGAIGSHHSCGALGSAPLDNRVELQSIYTSVVHNN
jgi:hypothetical protein